jgi:hypothetical protein
MFFHSFEINQLGLKMIHPTEVARQMTLLDSEIFKNIRPIECFRQRWIKRGKEYLSPNLLKMVDRFNVIARWVSTEIVCERNENSRVLKLIYFTLLCKELLKIGNLHGAMQGIVIFFFVFILFLFYFYFIFILFLFLFYFYFIFILFLFYFYFIILN